MSEKLYQFLREKTPACKYIQDTFWAEEGNTLAVVENGEIVKKYKWTRIQSLKLAIFSAARCKQYYGDKQIFDDCISIAEKILNEYSTDGVPTGEMVEAAEAAACDAWAAEVVAWTAETAAEAAAEAAAWAAAEAAEYSAAEAAAWAAAEAARAEVKQKIHEYCLEIIEEVE